MDKDQVELMRRRLTDDFRERIERKLIQRHTLFGLFILSMIGVSIYFLVDNMLDAARIDLESAIKVQRMTSDQLSATSVNAEALNRNVTRLQSDFSGRLSDLEARMNTLDANLDTNRKEAKEVVDRTLLLTADLIAELNALSDVVKDLTDSDAGSADAEAKIAVVKEKIEEIQRALGRSDQTVTETLKTTEEW